MPEVPDTVDDAIEPLDTPSTNEVFEATRPFSAREIASAAASEALAGGSGLPGWWTVNDTPGVDGDAVIVRLDLPQAVQDWLDNVANAGDVFTLFDADGAMLWSLNGYGKLTLTNGIVASFIETDVATVGSYLSHGSSDAIVVQGSGTINKTALDPGDVEYRWNVIGDRVDCNLELDFDTGTAGQSGQPLLITLPSLPLPQLLRGANGLSCGVARADVGVFGGWGFVEVASVGGQVRVVIDKIDTIVLGSSEALGSGDRISAHFSYPGVV